MYPQPIHSQQTWSSAQFAQGPKHPTISTWPTAPVISTRQNPATGAVPHVGPHPSFVPPAPPGVNPQQWQNGRWMYTAPPGGVSNAQPHGLYPPPSVAGWHIPAAWGIAQQYYYPQAHQEKHPDKSYWDTKLSDNGLGLENMHIKCAISSFCSLTVPNASLIRSANHRQQRVAHAAPGEGDAPRTPWAWVPELDDDDSPTQQPDSAHQYHSAQQSLQPSPVEPAGRPNGATASAAVSGTGFPGPGSGHQAPPSHAYFSVPADQQQQQQQQHHQSSTTETGSSSRPVLPPPAVYSTHVRQQSNNPPQTTTATHHHHPSAAPAPHPATSLPSQPTAQAIQRSHTLAAPTPQRPGQAESFTSVKQLRPTFSPNIVRTPNHYRQDSHPVPSPRVTTWDEANSNSAGASTSANKHLSGAMQGGSVVPSPRVLPWSAHARANDGGSPTPAPRQPRTSRTEPSRIYAPSARPSQPVQRSYSIPEPPRHPAPVSRQNSMPVVPGGPDSHRHHSQPSIADLPQFAEEPGVITSLSPLIGTGSSVSSESSTSTIVVAQSPPPLFVPPRHSRSPSPSPQHRRSRSSSPSSSSSDSDSEDSDSGGHRRRCGYRSPTDAHGRHRTYSGHSGHHHHHHHRHHPHYQHNSNNNTNRYSGSSGGGYPGPGAHTPQGRSPASSTHTYQSSSSSNPLPTPPQERRDPGFSLPPTQQPEPPRGTYSRQLRYGFWNRRGDYLTMDKYVVYAPPGHTNPPDLKGYPSPTDGYMDHYGNFLKYDPTRKELPESLPRQGQPPQLPYDKVSTARSTFFFYYVSVFFFFSDYVSHSS